MIDSASMTAANSITTALYSAADNADKLSRFTGNSGVLLQSMIGLMTAGQQVQASAAVIRADDQTQESLLNILA